MARHATNTQDQYSETLQVRLTKQQVNLLKAKTLEQNVSISSLIRQAVVLYLNRTLSDTELLYASMNENVRNIRYLDNKVELLALIIMEQTKYQMRVLPSNPVNTDENAEFDYSKFEKNCFKSLRQNHRGKLESMLIDCYEQSGELEPEESNNDD